VGPWGGGGGGVRQFSVMGGGLIWVTVLHPLWGVNSPWRMFLNDFYLSSGSTGPLKSN
jgi:hypothetical protein